ncbi:MAG: ATP-binding protein [Methylococcaceae bacterium]
MTDTLKLPAHALKLTVDLSHLELTQSTSNATTILGQPRASAALAFGVAMPQSGYNIFVMGSSGSGRLSLINQQLRPRAANLPIPCSYVYVDSSHNEREPIALALPASQGHAFGEAIESLLDQVLALFPAAFEDANYQQKKTIIERDFEQTYNQAIELAENKARAFHVALIKDENNDIRFAPIRNGNALNEEQIALLPPLDKKAFYNAVATLEDYLYEVLRDLPQWRDTMSDKIKQLQQETINQALTPLFAKLHHTYQNLDAVMQYLHHLQNDLQQTISNHLQPQRNAHERYSKSELLADYAPNILIDHAPDSGAPIVYEHHPTYANLFGHIGYTSDQGALVTHYRYIVAGALHKANGGYLILDAEKILDYPFVWEGLKRALQTAYIHIESPNTELMGVHTVTLKPQAIPLNVKIILLGSADIYYLLEELDSEFNQMFRVLADFDSVIPRTEQTLAQFAQLLQQQAAELHAPPLARGALEALIEHSCRRAENQHGFCARLQHTLSIISEAVLFAGQCRELERQHIEQALTAREFRHGKLSQIALDDILDGTILLKTDGVDIGKINGLTVIEIGGSCFGAPARITATVHSGNRGIVDIEREAELGLAIHSKGVMILTGYLGHCYAQHFPLAISASIAIEQSYGEIDGDSASLAELCCLISALTRIPIKQNIAVTGSINQYGEVQAIGGVNEKIEGFFRLCQARGLTGQHAVIIPSANKRHLMLKQEVIDAVNAELFSIYAVSSVDETLELLTGEIAGIIDEAGNYSENSIHSKAITRLKEISEVASDSDAE